MVELLRARGKAEPVLLVVGVEDVLKDGAGFSDGDVGVGFVDSWEAAFGVDGFVFWGFELGQIDELILVGDIEFREEERYL